MPLPKDNSVCEHSYHTDCPYCIIENLIESQELLIAFINDVLPQAGKLVIKDFAGLNNGLLLSDKTLKKARELVAPFYL